MNLYSRVPDMKRRSFIAALLASSAPPAYVRAGSLMRVNPRIIMADPYADIAVSFVANMKRSMRQDIAAVIALASDPTIT